MPGLSAVLKPAFSCLLPHVGGFAGAIVTRRNIPDWYKTLQKPPWTPPNWLFGPVWTALYTGMGYAAYMVWRDGGGFSEGSASRLPLALYGTQLALNWSWSPLFFGSKMLGVSALEICALWATVLGCVITFGDVNVNAGRLMMPYLAWPRPVRLTGVLGTLGNRNDVIFCGNAAEPPTRNVVFFGGDVQDYKENMLAHRENFKFAAFDLEGTASLLKERLSASVHLWLVRPSSMMMGTFSIYSSLVGFDNLGLPLFSKDTCTAFPHLTLLLMHASDQMNSTLASNGDIGHCRVDVPLTLCAFSKGCVVLNQLLFELGEIRRSALLQQMDVQVTSIAARADTWVWLDGGHNGGRDTWVTDDSSLFELTRELPVDGVVQRPRHVCAYVTPYQVEDSSRPWLRREYNLFCSKLNKLQIHLETKTFFKDRPRSLNNHFELLKEFPFPNYSS